MTKINWLITDSNVTVNFNGETHIVSRSDKFADRLIKAIKENDLDSIPSLVNAAKRIQEFSDGNFVVKDGQILINGEVVPEVLGRKIKRFADEGLPYQPLVRFAENLKQNPSYRAVNELFQFLEKNDHPITEDGCFIAYKKVRSDFKDIYTGTFDNSVGQTVKVPRNEVDEDCNRTCSKGLHLASWKYAHDCYGSYSGDDIMLEVKVNPRDVVAVPVDYNNAKMRVCEYVVLSVVTNENTDDALRITNCDTFGQVTEDGRTTEGCCGNCSHCTCCDDEDEWEDDEEEEEDDYPWEEEDSE